MSDVRPAGPYPLPHSGDIETWLVRFDKDGVCTSPGTQAALLQRLNGANADVIFFAHGWQTDFNGATDQYDRFLQSFNDVLGQKSLTGKNLYFVGVTWPSKWLASTPGPRMAGANDTQADEFAGALSELTALLNESEADRVRMLAAQAILNRDEARELALLLSKSSSPTVGETDRALAAEVAIDLAAALAPSGDTNDPDYVGAAADGAAGADVAADGFDPFSVVRLFSLYQMKDRAGRVGTRGVSKLLTGLTGQARSVHVVGHSFGAKVMMSAIKGDTGRAHRPTSLFLLQPAISHLCFAPELDNEIGKGGYAGVPAAVAGQVFTTFSRHDFPLHRTFHLALRRDADEGEAQTAADEPPSKYAALGGYGPRSAHELLIDLPANGGAFNIPETAKIIGLDGGPESRIPGHSDVQNVHTAWALRRQIEKG